MKRIAWATIGPLACMGLMTSFSVSAEQRASGNTIEEIIVTAQKREESINDVGMSIEASSGEQLKELGITDAFDLYKVVTGFWIAYRSLILK